VKGSFCSTQALKSAFYVADSQATYRVGIHALVTDQSRLKVETFEEREAASNWLGVAVETLAVL